MLQSQQQYTSELVAGVDEAGRGPLAGAVVASAVILPPHFTSDKIMDSKKLTEKSREACYDLIMACALAVGIGECSAQEIDELNILQASLLAMQRAVQQLTITPARVEVDGNRAPDLPFPTTAIIKGDATVLAIGAASIIAKVTRDRQMLELDARYPEYGFAKHKGYPTVMHRQAIERYGVLPIHRRSFGPVKKCLSTGAEAIYE